MNDDNFLSRWSRRKIDARTAAPAPSPVPPGPATPPPKGEAAASSTPAPATPEPRPLPPIESLRFESDFSAFMQPHVDAALRRQALKTLLTDPRFNVMDGLDVYIDDYTKADPLPDGWLAQMRQFAQLGNHEPGVTDPPAAAAAAQPGESVPEGAREAAAPPPEAPAEPPAAPPESDTSAGGSLPAESPESRP